MTSPFQQFSDPAEAGSPTVLNSILESLMPAGVFGRDYEHTTALTWGYYGGRWGGFAITTGTVALTLSTTNYVVAATATGVVSVSTATTNWNDSANYSRLYKIVTGASTVTSYEDHRGGAGGSGGGGGGGGGSGTVTHTGGALTSNAVVLGAGSADTKVVTGISTDGASALNLGVAGSSVGKVVLANATSGTITLQPPTGALGTATVTVPAATDTLVNLASSQSLSSKTFVAPILGTPASGNLSSCTADGTDSVGFRNIPQNSKSAAYTTVLADAGKHLYHPGADTTARTWTIDSNANVAYPIGTAITFVNDTSGGVITIAITSDTMILAGAGTTGSRSLAANGIATAVKMTTTRWIISGTGLT